ncbi:MAG: Hsp70 family protein [Anaerolineae bacterium]|nr:Hsp70 family protein [Anaerolineae bacterium]
MTKLNVGLDFGTSNSGVAVYNGQKIHLLPIDGRNLVPEVVKTILYITRDQQAYIGQEAIDLYYRHNINRPRRFVKKKVAEIEYVGAEMFYVQDVNVFVDELQPGRLLQFIKTGLRLADYKGTQVFDEYYDLKRLIKTYLQQLKQRAEAILGQEIYGVTVGRPVRFLDAPELDQRAEDTLRQAAFEAGFQQVEVEFEPMAAALFYETSLDRPQNVLIFDFGGGTLDLTVVRLGDPAQRTVFATGGIGLAGSNFDRTIIQKRLAKHFGQGTVDDNPEVNGLINAIAEWQSLPALSTPRVQTMIQDAAKTSRTPTRFKALEALIYNNLAFSLYNKVEAAKMALSQQGTSVIRMVEEDVNIWELYTRFQFEQDIQEHRRRIETCLLDTVAASGLEPEQIDAVIKTGGSSSIPCFTQTLTEFFGLARVKTANVFSSVTAGLAVKAFEM